MFIQEKCGQFFSTARHFFCQILSGLHPYQKVYLNFGTVFLSKQKNMDPPENSFKYEILKQQTY